MGQQYEVVKGEKGLPIKAIIHSVSGLQMHWHNEIEILLVLEGSVNVRIGKKLYILKENDLILINCNELHNTTRTEDTNVLLALQIDPEFYNNIYLQFNKMEFDCKSFIYGEDKQERFDIIRYYIAKIVWELNKKNQGYQLVIGSYLHLLGAHLINNFDYTILEDETKELRDKDLYRLQSIIDYVNQNIDRKITLKEVAEREHINYYYLSHFIKDKMGMSFQEYLNTIRLNNAVDMLTNTDMTVTDLSFASGFSNTNSFYKLFNEIYNCSPLEYRKRYEDMPDYINDNKSCIGRSYLDVNRTSALKKLFNYLEPIEVETLDTKCYTANVEKISVNTKGEGQHFGHYWQKLTTFGRAAEGLRANWRSQFKEMQKEIGFEYIRFHGIFMDEMMIFNTSKEGKIEYNWTYADELFDFFMEMNIKPFVELGFMPDELKRSDETVFWWKGNISPPKDIKLWTDLVQDFIKHCINRYGIKEVESWYFEVWNEPEYRNLFWSGSREEYFEFYRETALAIKSISEDLKVGGPAITHGTILGSTWLEDFLTYCNSNEVPLDFLSMHIYQEYISQESIEEDYSYIEDGVGTKDVPLTEKIYHDREHTLNTIMFIKDMINISLNYKPEIHITEWNASSLLGNLIHDTAYVAAFIIKNILDCIDTVDSLGYWTFTDIFEEHKLGISPFHGGFGLISKDGLKKPSYYAYYLLSKLGEEILKKGRDYIVTKDGENIQILAYNYVYFDDLFLSGDTSHLSYKDRYSIYEEKPLKELEVNINGIEGKYKIARYKLNKENGSVFDEWINMGATENMTKEEIEYLKGKSKPDMKIEYLKLEGKHKEKLFIPVHGVELVMLEKVI